MSDSGLSTGEAGAEQLRHAYAATEDPVLRHAHAIRHVHLDVGKGLDLVMSRASMQVCRDLIAQRVPCRRDDAEVYAAVALLGYGSWPEALAEETAELMRLYIRSGYFRMNDRVDAFGAEDYSGIFKPGYSNLEVAIRQGNVEAIVVLVEEGERVDAVPHSRLDGQPSFADMFELAEAWWTDPVIPTQMRAAAMRRHIIEASKSPLAPTPVRRLRTRAV